MSEQSYPESIEDDIDREDEATEPERPDDRERPTESKHAELIAKGRALVTYFGPDLANNPIVAECIAELVYALESANYPRNEDPFIVLGPELFADQSGDVLCWKGVNYVRQVAESPTTVECFGRLGWATCPQPETCTYQRRTVPAVQS